MAYTLTELQQALKSVDYHELESNAPVTDAMVDNILGFVVRYGEIRIEHNLIYLNLQLEDVFSHVLSCAQDDDWESVSNKFHVSMCLKRHSFGNADLETVWLLGWDNLIGYGTEYGDSMVGVKYTELRRLWCKSNNQSEAAFEDQVKTILGRHYDTLMQHIQSA